MDCLQHCWSHRETCVFVISSMCASVSLLLYLHYSSRIVPPSSVPSRHAGFLWDLSRTGTDNGFMSHCGGCYLMWDCCLTSWVFFYSFFCGETGSLSPELIHKMDVVFTDSWLVFPSLGNGSVWSFEKKKKETLSCHNLWFLKQERKRGWESDGE